MTYLLYFIKYVHNDLVSDLGIIHIPEVIFDAGQLSNLIPM